MITPELDLRSTVLNNILKPKKDYHSFNKKSDQQKAEEYGEDQHRAFLHHELTMNEQYREKKEADEDEVSEGNYNQWLKNQKNKKRK